MTGAQPLNRKREAVRHGDATLDVIVEGAGPALVLLPSSLRDSLDFDPLAERLAHQGWRVIRPQPRGMGHSSPPTAGMTLATLADDVAAVIDHLSAAPAVVVGHAYGHWVARQTDLRHPQRVRGVVALGAAARVFPPGMAESLAIASDPVQREEDRLAALRHCMFAPGNDPAPWLAGWYPQWRAAYRAASQWPPRDTWYDQGHAPLLDLHALGAAHDLLRVMKHGHAGWRWPHATGAAYQQGHAQRVFQFGDALAHCRGYERLALGGAGHARFLADGDEEAQGEEVGSPVVHGLG